MHVILDAEKLDTKENSHRYLAEIFGFPDYYGNNLDALYDCLSELSDLNIHILHNERAGEYYEKVLSVFDDLDECKMYIN